MIELDDLLQATDGKLWGEVHARQFAELAFDSRRIEGQRADDGGRPGHGPLFVAVRSDTGDGHDYIPEAVRRGATGVLCQRVPHRLPSGVTCVVVDDTRQALLDWARHILIKHGPQVIGVTGSSGKTTTKEAIAAVLGVRYPVFKNPGSYSGRYGLPIALGGLGAAHKLAVLELALDSQNEVRDLTALTQPTVGVVTTVNQAHVQTLGSVEAIAREKGTLIEALPAGGYAILNRDDPRVWRMRERTRAQVIGYGLDESADVRAVEVSCTEEGLSFSLLDPRAYDSHIEHNGQAIKVTLRLLGRHHVYAVLAAIAVGRVYGVPLPEMLSALAQLDPLPGRLRPIAGRNGAILLDDSYDAELACTLAALDALADHYPRRRRIAVLGSLRRWGYSEEAERLVGERAAQAADELVIKGERAQAIRAAATVAGLAAARVFVTYTNEEAARYLAQRVADDDVVLIKGAREERMEEIAQRLLRDPESAPDLLVRQEPAFRHVQLALPERPTWLEVDLGAIAGNLHRIRQIVGPQVDVMAVLKADGYGHGAIRIARTAVNNGAHMLGVACLSEGVLLRQADIGAPILVLGYTPAWQARDAVLHHVTATVFDLDTARAFSRAAGEVGQIARVHVKVDTGMGRLGLLPDQVLPFLLEAIRLPSLQVEGIFTHFSVADDADKSYTRWQLRRFSSLLDQVREAGISIPLIHAANSAALLTLPEARFDMVRLGIAIYGLAPSEETPLPPGFRPAFQFKTRVAQVKDLPPGSAVSYGNTYRTRGEETIAVIPVGYADGFRRAPARWQYVLVHGQRAPIVGRVCMDQTMINVTHIPGVRQGDEVVLIGRQGDRAITVEQVAEWLGTINYEVISEILARVPRVS
jgi:alanine racemase